MKLGIFMSQSCSDLSKPIAFFDILNAVVVFIAKAP